MEIKVVLSPHLGCRTKWICSLQRGMDDACSYASTEVELRTTLRNVDAKTAYYTVTHK